MKTLLPPGCYDVLPPFARQESQISAGLLDVFTAYGYAQVAPTLLEYSDNLLAGRGAALSSQMFRVMDPAAHRVMAVRPDITLQIARIASGALKDAPRPLRLCYDGLILRLQGGQLNPSRQLRQVGIELIGASSAAADAEVILIASRALSKAGVHKFTIDLSLPSIVSTLVAEDKLNEDQMKNLNEALSRKDTTTIENLALTHKKTLIALIENAGDAESVLQTIHMLKLPPAARELCNNLRAVVEKLEMQREHNCTLTIDVTDSQGYAYHSGVGFTIFAPGVAQEVGRGGRYRIEDEEATGFTLYIETLRSLLPSPGQAEIVLVAKDTPKAECEILQAKGMLTLYAHDNMELVKQAKALGCTQIFENGTLKMIR